jgi:4-hydroxybenzoate polyprenyltransferase
MAGPQRAGVGERLAGLVRLTHPFPSLLDGVATAAFALLAGAPVATAGRLGMAMVGLQAAIGSLNDIVDVPRDAGLKPGKPIPAGLVSRQAAALVALLGAALGLGLSLPSGPATALLALVVLTVGGLYDLRFKGTAWSWLPFAVGIPLLPVFAWLGAAGRVPGAFVILIPAAALAGAALAVSNALTDVERDRAAGTITIVTHLGPRRAWWLHLLLQLAVGALALVGLAWLGGRGIGLLGVAAGAAAVAMGVALGRDASPGRREMGWELEAVGVAVLAVCWVGAVGRGLA